MTTIPKEMKALILSKRPGEKDFGFADDLFEEKTVPVPQLNDGEVLVEMKVLSCDPTQRIWATDIPQYMPPVQIGEEMRCGGAGIVVDSKHPKFSVGDQVSGLASWAEFNKFNGDSPFAWGIVPAGVPLHLGVASYLCPSTAYVGLVCRGQVRPGDTVFVSGAAGATGSMVVQMATLFGCRVIGTAGSKEKCDYVVSLGAEVCINYKTESIIERLTEVAKDSINVFFDNVGGDSLDAALANIARGARIVICGAISTYAGIGTGAKITGPANYGMLLMRRATMVGFIFNDNPLEVDEAQSRIQAWLATGKLKMKVDPIEAPLTDAPKIVRRLFEGANNGKTLHILKK